MTEEFLKEFGSQMDRHEKWSDLVFGAKKLIEENKIKKAILLLEEANEITDEDDVMHESLLLDSLAYAHHQEGNLDKAEELYKRIIDLCDVDPYEHAPLKYKPTESLPEDIQKILLADLAKQAKGVVFSFKMHCKRVLTECEKNFGKLLEDQDRADELVALKKRIKQVKQRVAKVEWRPPE